jgi:hypothetical protein
MGDCSRLEKESEMMGTVRQYRFIYLFAALLLTTFVAPVIGDYKILRIVFDIFLSMIFFSGCFAVSRSRYVPWIAIALSVPMLASIWVGYFGGRIPRLDLIGDIFGVLYFGLIAIVILGFIFSTKHVSSDIIIASLVVYLLFGIMWGFSYQVLELLQPGSFRAPDGFFDQAGSGFMYYSFITLTTIGYGDVTPISGIAQSFSQLEGIVGQSYMAVLVARLVGLHVAEGTRE